MATSMACNATMVLPEPTSPCSSRRMGLGSRMSATISPSARFCAAVGWKGSTSRMASRTLSLVAKRDAAALFHAPALQLEAQLQKEQLFKDEPAMGRSRAALQLGERRAFRRKVDFAQRGFAAGKTEPLEHRRAAGIRAPRRACFRAD